MITHTRHLRYLAAIADTGSFSRAAEQLCVSQPALSRRISSLEHELGIAFFDRTPKRTQVTTQGAQLMEHVREVLESVKEVEAAILEIKRSHQPLVRIGAAVYAPRHRFSKLIAAYEEKHPSAKLQLQTSPRAVLAAGLQMHNLDVVLTVSPPIPDQLEHIVIEWIDVHAIMPANSHWACAPLTSAASLAGCKVVSLERKRQPELFDALITPLESAGATIVYPDDQTPPGLLSHAASIGGIAINMLTNYSSEDIEASGMVARPLPFFGPVAGVMLFRLIDKEDRVSDSLWNFARHWAAREAKNLDRPDGAISSSYQNS